MYTTSRRLSAQKSADTVKAFIEIDLDSAVPPFEQVRAGLEALIRNGTLTDGTRLQTVRALAGDLGLAAGTVARAYRELEAAGLLRTARRSGSVVVAPQGAAAPGKARALPPEVSDAVVHLMKVARAHGVALDALHTALDGNAGSLPAR